MITYHDAQKKVMRGCDGSHPSCDLQWCRLSDFLSKRCAVSISCVAEHLICIPDKAGPVCIVVKTEFMFFPIGMDPSGQCESTLKLGY